MRQLHAHPQNPRKQLTVDDLAESIKESGQLVPLIVRRVGMENFEIISGHRRKAALESIGEKYADCDLIDMTDEEAYRALMVTNIQAQTLSEIEEAEGIKSMMEKFNWTQSQVAKEFGKSQKWVSFRLSLLKLDESVQENLSTRVLTATHAREIAQLPTEQQAEVVQKIIDENRSTRETAELVKEIIHPKISESSKDVARATNDYVTGHNESISKEDTTRAVNASLQEDDYNTRYKETTTHVTSEEKVHAREQKPINREPSPKIKASDYITKFYRFLADTDTETIDGIFELGDADHVMAIIDKTIDTLKWMRNKVDKSKSEGSNVVEFKRREVL